MSWKKGIAVLALLGILVPTGSAGDDDITCSPYKYPVSGTILVAGSTFYVVEYNRGMQNYVELWQEINGLEGLQMTSAQACGDPADKRFEQVCYVRCLVPL